MKERLLIFKEEKVNFQNTINILILIMILSGIFGFIYETIFYRIDLGYFVKRGSSFGPWIPIYVYGGLLITLITYRLKNKPLLLFLTNILVTGTLEFLTGYILDKFMNTRLWDYNVEIWNFGNIGGYICLRSILFFGLSSLFLIYILIPLLIKISSKISQRKLSLISFFLLTIYLIDIITYTILN